MSNEFLIYDLTVQNSVIETAIYLEDELGITGPTGTDGLQGSQGAQGLIGSASNTGATGPIGTQGFKGDQGDVGPIGIQGDTGPTGAQGSQGFVGTAVNTGATGPTGVGAQGSQGLVGTAANTGATGPTGFGAQGSQGPAAILSEINYSQNSSGSVTITNGTSFPQNIISTTITTSGNPVQIICGTDVNSVAEGGWAQLRLYRDSTPIGQIIQAESGVSSGTNTNIPFTLNFIDTPSSGSYTYYCKLVGGSYGTAPGGNLKFGEAGGPVITVTELNSAKGLTGHTGPTGYTGPAGGLIKATQLMDNVQATAETINGPATISNWTKTYVSNGGSLSFMTSFSAFSTSGGSKVFNILADGIIIATSTFFFNQTNIHMTIPSFFNIENFLAGSYSISITIPSGVSVDLYDYAHMSIQEYVGANSIGLTGPTGQIGSQGITGPTGSQGRTGPTGSQGITGPTGTAGLISGSWTLNTGANTVSFTVDQNGTYVMWVRGNIPNGICIWNATVSISNSNVPVIGNQYGWYYTLGNQLVLTSIPNQIIGTSGSISTESVITSTANVFTFGITNNSSSIQTVYYGYFKVNSL